MWCSHNYHMSLSVHKGIQYQLCVTPKAKQVICAQTTAAVPLNSGECVASNTLNSACISGTDRELLVQPEWRLHGHCMFSAADCQSGEDKSCIVRIVSQFD